MSDIGAAPEWYRLNPVQLHTRLAPLAFERALGDARPEAEPQELRSSIKDIAPALSAPAAIAYLNAGKRAADLGARVLVRHVKTRDEPPPWTTDVPAPNRSVDLVSPMVEEAHAAGVRMIGYYWHMSDILAADAHPDWVCQRGKSSFSGRRGAMIDLLSPFGDMTAVRLEELRALGVDGIYLDGRHSPNRGCRGATTEVAFEQVFGEKWSKARQDEFDIFNANAVQQVLDGWTDRFIDDPEFATIVSMAKQPNLVERDATIELARVGIPKTEFELPAHSHTLNVLIDDDPDLEKTLPQRSTRIATALSLLREVSGAPPHVWIHRVSGENNLFHAVGAVLTNGATANVDVGERDLGGALSGREIEAFKAVFDLNDLLGPLLAGAKPLRFAAVHFSENARNRRDRRAGWLEVVAPTVHGFGALTGAGLPVAAIDDRMLAEGDLSGFEYLFTPVERELTETQIANLRTHDIVVHALPRATTGAKDLAGVYMEAISAAVTDRELAPVTIETDDPNAQATIMYRQESGDYLVQIVASFDHIRTGNRKGDAEPTPHEPPKLASRLKVKLSLPDSGAICARDVIADQPLETNPQGWIILPVKRPYTAIVYASC